MRSKKVFAIVKTQDGVGFDRQLDLGGIHPESGWHQGQGEHAHGMELLDVWGNSPDLSPVPAHSWSAECIS